MDLYIDRVLEDYRALHRQLDPWHIPTVYIGGGTPSVLGKDNLCRLLNDLKSYGNMDNSVPYNPEEITLEVNPESINEDLLYAVRDAGVNRLSLGIQSFHDASRKAVHRAGEGGIIDKKLKQIGRIFQDNFSADLMSGLPFQDENILRRDIEKTIESRPAHISLYALTLENDSVLKNKNILDKGFLPSTDEADKLWISGRDLLEKEGYGQYEVSNFCIPGKESRHNLRYWRMENWLGLGPAASSTIIDSAIGIHGTGTGLRFTNNSDLDLWLDRKSDEAPPGTREILDPLTLIKETFLMGFRYIKGPDEALFRKRFKKNMEAVIPETIKIWRTRGLMQKDTLALTKPGLLLLDSFLIDAFKELE